MVSGWQMGHIFRNRGGATSLYAVGFAEWKAARLATAELPVNANNISLLGFSPSGALYYRTISGQSTSSISLGTIDFAAGKFAVAELPNEFGSRSAEPLWSPDGKLFTWRSFSLARPGEMLGIRPLTSENVHLIGSAIARFSLTDRVDAGPAVCARRWRGLQRRAKRRSHRYRDGRYHTCLACHR